jgi:hypothetical protein
LRFDTVNARFVGDRCAEEREREDDVLLCFACSRFSRVCVSSHRRERERELFPRKLGSKDERGDESKNTPKRVCVLWEGIKLAWNEDCVGIRLRGPMSRTRGAIGARESEHRITRPRFHSPSTAGAFTTSYGFRLYRSGTKGAISTPPRRPSNKPDQLGAR